MHKINGQELQGRLTSMMFKIKARYFIVWVLIVLIGPIALAQPAVNSPAAVLLEANNGQILWEKNSEDRRHIASITKIMTILLVLEAVEKDQFSLDDLVTVSEEAKRQGGSQIWLETGEQMSVKDLLYSLAVGSANDSAVALSEFHSGSESAFVEKMNQRALELGLTNTHFVNSNGLPEKSHRVKEGDHYSTAKDIAKLTYYAYRYPLFETLVSTYEYTVRPGQKGEVVLYNYNKLFLKGYPGADGVKTGMIEAAGYCLSGSAVRDELRLIAVVLGSKSNAERYKDITAVLDYGFNNYKSMLLTDKETLQTELLVSHGKVYSVGVYAKDNLKVTLKKGIESKPIIEVEIKDKVQAPLKKGEVVGSLTAKVADEVVGEVELIVADEVERATLWQEISRSFLQLLGIKKG